MRERAEGKMWDRYHPMRIDIAMERRALKAQYGARSLPVVPYQRC